MYFCPFRHSFTCNLMYCCVQISYRAFSLDVVCLLLSESERDDVGDGDEAVFATHTFLLHMLLARCSDVAPT